VNLDEWEGVAGKPATKVARITYDYLANFDVRQADSAVAYIKQHAKDDKPFFMDVNFMKMHNPTNPDPAFRGKSKLGNYSDSMLELDANIGRVMDAIRAEAPNTIVIITADNGAWQDAWPDAGVTPFRPAAQPLHRHGDAGFGVLSYAFRFRIAKKGDDCISNILVEGRAVFEGETGHLV
jgi:arylsulfatase